MALIDKLIKQISSEEEKEQKGVLNFLFERDEPIRQRMVRANTFHSEQYLKLFESIPENYKKRFVKEFINDDEIFLD